MSESKEDQERRIAEGLKAAISAEAKNRLDMLKLLLKDQSNYRQLLDSQSLDTQFVRRTYVRGLFAGIEGITHVVRRWVEMEKVEAWSKNPTELNKEFATELAALLEVTPRIEHTGKIAIEESKVKSINLTAFTVRSLAEHVKYKEIDKFFGDNRWFQLKAAFEVRNRITHPKSPESLEITKDEINVINTATTWMLNTLVQLADQLPKVSVSEDQADAT